jgi:Domain of unknown function (DUF3850)
LKTHILKTDPTAFADVLSGAKTFEIRLNDRGFEVGDTLQLLETEHDGADMRSGAPLIYTGREITKTVSHIQTGYGLAEGWCCLSFASGQGAQKLGGLRSFLAGWRLSDSCIRNEMQTTVDRWIEGIDAVTRPGV